MIIVVHRLTTVRGDDRIVVMDEGQVAETGTHNDLVKAGGLYAELVRMQ
ncbi:hypothetical protein [Coralliovum pocilloporae]